MQHVRERKAYKKGSKQQKKVMHVRERNASPGSKQQKKVMHVRERNASPGSKK